MALHFHGATESQVIRFSRPAVDISPHFRNPVALAVEPLTMVAWGKPNANNDSGTLVCVSDITTGTDYHILHLGSDGNIVAITRGTGGNRPSGGQAYLANVWTHFGARFKSNINRQGFLNGVPDVASTNAVIHDDPLDTFAIGRVEDSSPGAPVDGHIAEVCIWNIDLTDGEMMWLYQSQLPPPLALPHRRNNIVVYKSLRNFNTPEDIGFSSRAFVRVGESATTIDVTEHPPIRIPDPSRRAKALVAAEGPEVIHFRSLTAISVP